MTDRPVVAAHRRAELVPLKRRSRGNIKKVGGIQGVVPQKLECGSVKVVGAAFDGGECGGHQHEQEAHNADDN